MMRFLRKYKMVLQVVLAIAMLVVCVYFFKNQEMELKQIGDKLHSVHLSYMLLGLAVTGLFIVAQGYMYVFSYRAMGVRISLRRASALFLKRNLVSVFLPAGGFSSLAFFTGPLKDKGVETTDIHYGSSIYAFNSLVSVVVTAFPVIVFLLFRGELTRIELIPFVTILVFILLVTIGAWSLLKKRLFYRFLVNTFPNISHLVEDIVSKQLQRKYVVYSLLFSVVVELTGIVHVYISMHALDYHPTFLVAFIAYIVMVMLLIMSPFLRGMGAIEVAVTYILVKSGLTAVAAASVTLVFRFFQFWIPLLAGLIVLLVYAFYLVIQRLGLKTSA